MPEPGGSAVEGPRPGEGPGEPLYESQRDGFEPPVAGAGDPEFEDEPPGAYLATLELGGGAVAWGGALLVLLAAMATASAALEPWTRLATVLVVLLAGEAATLDQLVPPWVPPLEFASSVFPVVAVTGFLVTAFFRLNLREASGRRRALTNLAVLLQLLALLLGLLWRWGHSSFL
jgi:hypothetical protein